MISCGILGTMTTSVFTEVGRLAFEGRFPFEIFEPIQGVGRGWVKVGRCLLLGAQPVKRRKVMMESRLEV